jgi:ribonucleotide reductase beta subunit family protein with ferritin-like domain
MARIIDSIKGCFHRELVSNPITHGWVLNLYRGGERYPQRVCDYFQSDYAPTNELAAQLRQHAAEEDKHVHLFSQAIQSIGQPVVEIELGDVFNEVIRSFTPGTFHILESDPTEIRRRKLANFMAHAHHLEKRVAHSFAYHMDACERARRGEIAKIVARTKTDEEKHVAYTRTTVFDLLTRREAQDVMEVHRRAEAKANLMFSQRQVRAFLGQFGNCTPKHRQWAFRVCATIMETAGQYV